MTASLITKKNIALLKAAGYRRTDRHNQEVWTSPIPDRMGYQRLLTRRSALAELKRKERK